MYEIRYDGKWFLELCSLGILLFEIVLRCLRLYAMYVQQVISVAFTPCLKNVLLIAFLFLFIIIHIISTNHKSFFDLCCCKIIQRILLLEILENDLRAFYCNLLIYKLRIYLCYFCGKTIIFQTGYYLELHNMLLSFIHSMV